MLTFSTLATRVSWTTDFCKRELTKSQMEQNTAENEAHVSSTMEPLGKMQKKLIQKYQIQSHTINSVSLLQQYIIILLSLLLLLLYYYYREFTKYSHTNFTKANKAQQ